MVVVGVGSTRVDLAECDEPLEGGVETNTAPIEGSRTKHREEFGGCGDAVETRLDRRNSQPQQRQRRQCAIEGEKSPA